jgi:tRNA A37 threonylcarbamoyladenosine synthetase subunit TsaC/SUA5/YrdC
MAYTNDPDEVMSAFSRSVDVFLDAGGLYGAPSTVVDLTGDVPVVLRQGSGDTSWIE